MLKCGDKVKIISSGTSLMHAFEVGETVYFIGVFLDSAEPIFVCTNGNYQQGLHFGDFELIK